MAEYGPMIQTIKNYIGVVVIIGIFIAGLGAWLGYTQTGDVQYIVAGIESIAVPFWVDLSLKWIFAGGRFF